MPPEQYAGSQRRWGEVHDRGQSVTVTHASAWTLVKKREAMTVVNIAKRMLADERYNATNIMALYSSTISTAS